MRRLWLFAAFVAVGALASSAPAQEKFRGGIVYGPKAAFKIDAPEGWVLDNESGAQQGLPCVLYPKGSTWAEAKTVIYGKIAGTQFEDVEKFVAMAIKEMEKTHGKPKEKIDKGKTGDGQPYFINEYPASKSYSQWERVAYVQLPKAVAYIVLSSQNRSQLSQRRSGAEGGFAIVCLHQSGRQIKVIGAFLSARALVPKTRRRLESRRSFMCAPRRERCAARQCRIYFRAAPQHRQVFRCRSCETRRRFPALAPA